MVTFKKTWETVLFYAKNNEKEVVVELNINHATGSYVISTKNQEMVSFNDDTIEISELKMEALAEIFKYLKKNLPKPPQPKNKK